MDAPEQIILLGDGNGGHGLVGPNEEDIGSHNFTIPGTYWYYCNIGSHAVNCMIGKIIVT